MVVDAIDDDAAEFYRRWGFINVPENSHRLFRKISDIRRALDQSEGDRRGVTELAEPDE